MQSFVYVKLIFIKGLVSFIGFKLPFGLKKLHYLPIHFLKLILLTIFFIAMWRLINSFRQLLDIYTLLFPHKEGLTLALFIPKSLLQMKLQNVLNFLCIFSNGMIDFRGSILGEQWVGADLLFSWQGIQWKRIHQILLAISLRFIPSEWIEIYFHLLL